MRVWESQSGELLHVLEGHTGWVQVRRSRRVVYYGIVSHRKQTMLFVSRQFFLFSLQWIEEPHYNKKLALWTNFQESFFFTDFAF